MNKIGILAEKNLVTVYGIECRTGCTCCACENYVLAFFKESEEPKKLIEKWRKGDGNPLASQYEKHGVYHLKTYQAEILPDGRMIIEDRVYLTIDGVRARTELL